MIPRWLWLVPPAFAGTLLRVFLVGRQVAGGDELHTVRAALQMPLSEILVTYLPADHCIPLTALNRLLLEAGVRLSEAYLRLPALASGVAFLIAAPVAVSKLLDRRTAAVFAWGVAISPGLVLYSRIARSYMPVVLLSAGAAWSFYRYVQSGARRYGILYAVLAAAAMYFHLVAAPFVLAPWIFLAGRLLVRREAAPELRGTAVVLAVLAAGCAAFAVPAMPSLSALVAAKHSSVWPSGSAVAGVLKLQAGSGSSVPAIVFWCLAILGLGRLRARDPNLFRYGLCLAFGQVAGLLVVRPQGMGHPLIFHRYLLVALPLVLLWVACGLAHPWQRSQRRWGSRATGWLPVAVLVLLFLAGPLADGGRYSGSFMHRNESLAYHVPTEARAVAAPPVYGRLAERGTDTILELPWPTSWRFGRIFASYQQAHGMNVMVSPVADVLTDDRLEFRNMVAPEPSAILASRAGYLLVHTRRELEEATLDPDRPTAFQQRDLDRRARLLGHESRKAARLAELLRRRWGPPDDGDERLGIHAWNLDRLRGSRGVEAQE